MCKYWAFAEESEKASRAQILCPEREEVCISAKLLHFCPLILILILLNINSASELHQPGSSVSQVPKSEMSSAWSSRDVEKLGSTCVCIFSFLD